MLISSFLHLPINKWIKRIYVLMFKIFYFSQIKKCFTVLWSTAVVVCVLCVFCNSARGHFSSVGTFTPTQNSLQMITTSSLDKGKNLTQAQLKVYRCYRVSHDKFPFYETVGNIWIYTKILLIFRYQKDRHFFICNCN